MRLLFYANISWRLIAKITSAFIDCYHVDQIQIPVPAKDIDIWNYAVANDCIIVTNDDDFINLSNAKGFPPNIVLLRTGNQSTNYIAELLIKHKAEIEALYASTEYGILEIY